MLQLQLGNLRSILPSMLKDSDATVILPVMTNIFNH